MKNVIDLLASETNITSKMAINQTIAEDNLKSKQEITCLENLEKMPMRRLRELSQAQKNATHNVKFFKICELFSAFYPSTWMVSMDDSVIETFRKAWSMALEGLGDKQIEYAIDLIAKAKTSFQKFPPNPQEFREICQMMPKPIYTFPSSLQIENNQNPEAMAEREKRIEAQYRAAMATLKELNKNRKKDIQIAKSLKDASKTEAAEASEKHKAMTDSLLNESSKWFKDMNA